MELLHHSRYHSSCVSNLITEFTLNETSTFVVLENCVEHILIYGDVEKTQKKQKITAHVSQHKTAHVLRHKTAHVSRHKTAHVSQHKTAYVS